MTSPLSAVLDAGAVHAWIDQDPDEATRAELRSLLERHESGDMEATATLTDAFRSNLRFGTAGLRGQLGPGPNRMNRAVVIRTAAGLSAYLRELVGEGFTVVIGYDARHGSHQFALDTAAVVQGAGGRALLFKEQCPTPVLAFAMRRLKADAGVMVTASHNPAQDNGYKVYLGGRVVTGAGQGALIVPPYDEEITRRIDAVGPLSELRMRESGWTLLGPELVEEYTARVAQCARAEATAPLRIVLTPMHGVGGEICRDALGRVGFDDVHMVPEQAQPDPDFPTLPFPNPEEPGALDLAIAMAREIDADLVIANDPDADRCAVAVPVPALAGDWRQLTGDDLGALLGEQAAELAAFTGQGVLASSIVSSRLLQRIAHAHGLGHQRTLTGFKWISRVPDLVFGYEEAVGYCVDPSSVHDKDGISAAVRVAVLASLLKQQGRNLLDLLDRLARDHGLHATSQLSLRVEDPRSIIQAMERLRAGGAPARLGDSPVVQSIDLLDGISDGSGGNLPPTDALMWTTASEDRVVVRPSGTEPKLKCYCEVVLPVGDRPVTEVRREAAARLAAIQDGLHGVLGTSST
ncbi:phospho-sugar mutase [Actinomyces trachealis]|uniref:phospho-sugar mutase n=1 Tax=Actinomyces trachealis TaxID=2763540 RepID=UPI001892A7A3|nr:phospho-sugar mutase [Actinomyces trachealis]